MVRFRAGVATRDAIDVISVAFVQRVLPHYRVPLFLRLHTLLARASVSVSLIYGQERPGAVPETVPLAADWARRIQNRYWSVGGRELCWQPCFAAIATADLVVVEQANRLLLNHLLMLRRAIDGRRLAFWGHGANLQSTQRGSWSERIKARLAGRVDWWFAYTGMSAQLVQASGFPAGRITVVENVIDDADLRNSLGKVTAAEIESLKGSLGIGNGRVALYCGSMHAEKRLDFLVRACIRLKELVPDLHVLCVGSGPEQGILESACASHPWMHFIGPAYGAQRAIYFAASEVQLMPGLVGLALLDSFVAGVPLFTTDVPTHSPEIFYLKNGVNGVMTAHSTLAYAEAVALVLSDPWRLSALRDGCRESAGQYTLDRMAANFANGIRACLAAPRR